MSDQSAYAAEAALWTGPLVLQLKNGRGWSVDDAQLQLGRDNVIVRFAGRNIAIIDRDMFRAWLRMPNPQPFYIDDVVWTCELGITFLAPTGCSAFKIDPPSLTRLVALI